MAENLHFVTPLYDRLRTEVDIKYCCVKKCGAEATHCHFLPLRYGLGGVDLYTCDNKDHVEIALAGLRELKEICDSVTEKQVDYVTEH